jgi:c-di-GMP phosphodiesterase Gmr
MRGLALDSTPTSIESTEELREALIRLQGERDALARSGAQTSHLLDAFQALLSIQRGDDPFVGVFASLRKVFHFSHALLLAPTDSSPFALECIAADPPALVGSRWPCGALFDKVAKGRVVATFSHDQVDEWRNAAALGLACEQAALYAPVSLHGQHSILMLLSEAGQAGFDRSHVALARRWSVLAAGALASHFTDRSVAEGQRLRELTVQLRRSEQAAQRNADLLNEVVNALPVGLTVQDATGRMTLVNNAAAAALGHPVAGLLGHTPWAPSHPTEAAARLAKEHFQAELQASAQREREQAVTIDGEARTLLVTSKPVRIFDELLLVSATLDITERKRMEDVLSRRAFHDPLTGLPNRALMAELVDKAMRSKVRGGMCALAFIDLDHFKQINDYYSHAFGDALLIAVAHRIRDHLRPSDTLARISGDEFLLLIDPLESVDHIQPVVDRLIEAMKQPFHIEGHDVLTSATIGVSVHPMHGDSYDSLCRGADTAMYRAKHHRRGSAGLFDAEVDGSGFTARMELDQQLRAALRDRHFKCAFQPKVDLRSGRVVGFEALVRWVEPDGHVRMPGSFIELAGELGLLDDITGLVLDDVAAALPTLMRWYGPDVCVSLNIGAKQAGDLVFMTAFIGQLDATGLASHIVVELTEDALVATQSFEHKVLPELRRIGVRVSIDDFGTGFSSLSTLADITADEVKVDRAFITAIHERERSQGILKAIESLCSALGISVVAEGVETQQELDYLRTNTSIGLAQGYFFSKPKFLEALAPPTTRSKPTHAPPLAEAAA